MNLYASSVSLCVGFFSGLLVENWKAGLNDPTTKRIGKEPNTTMCLAIPTLIKSIDGPQAEVEIGGVSRTISVALTPDAQVGDYVIVHTGFAISVLDEQEARETLKLFDELAAFEQAELESGALGSEAEA